MEQPNLIPPNGMVPQHLNTMQRPQSGNHNQQLHAKIKDDLKRNPWPNTNSWQFTFDIGQRAAQIMQLVTQLRFLQSDAVNCVNIARQFEQKTISDSVDAADYFNRMKQKLNEITQKRQLQVASMQNGGLGMPMNSGANMMLNGTPNMPNNAMAGMNMPDGNMGMPNGQLDLNAGYQNAGFPTHLQRQMQPSPFPPQQLQQLQQQQPNDVLDSSALQQPPNQLQMSNVIPINSQSAPSMNNNGQGQPPLHNQELFRIAQTMYNRTPDDQKNQLRQRVMDNMNDQQRAQMANQQGPDPILMRFFVSKARDMLQKQKSGQMNTQGPQQSGVSAQMGNNVHPQGSQPGQPSIDLSSILGQQANALKQQEFGEQVVPASNNASFGLGGQMNMPQNINPQMLGKQGSPTTQPTNNNPQLAAQYQMLKMQQEQQQRIRRQNVVAQQQAVGQSQQASQLHGQPGGLNAPNALNGGPAGQVNSPAMSMLNRPMAPPRQSNPTTPQQNRQPGMPPQTPMNAADQLLQHHQQMVNQNNQHMNQVNQANTQQNRNAILQQVPAQFRERLAHLPPQQISELLAKMQQGRQGNSMNQQRNQPSMPQTSMGASQPPATSQAGMGFMPLHTGNAAPNFNVQPPPNQQQPQQPTQMDSLQMQQRLQQQQQLRQRAMDLWPFPKQILTTLGLAIPQQVQVWGQLKDHIKQSQALLPPETLHKLQTMQNQWFETHPEDIQKAIQQLRQQLAAQQIQQQSGQQSAHGPSNASQPNGVAGIPNGQAPPAQMVPPAAPMQQPPNQALMPPVASGPNQGQPRVPNLQPPTQLEVNEVRQKYGAQVQNLTDDHIKQNIWRRKVETHTKMQQQQQMMQQQAALRQQHLQRAQQGAAGQPAPGGMPAQNQQHQQTPAQRPALPQQAPLNQQAGGQKRAPQSASSVMSDEIVEIPKPNAQDQSNAPLSLPMAATQCSLQPPGAQHQRPMGMPTKEQLARLPPPQRAEMLERMKRMEALRKANMMNGEIQTTGQAIGQQQQAVPAPSNATLNSSLSDNQMRERLRSMFAEVQQSTRTKGPGVQIDSKGIEQAQMLLRRMWQPLSRVEATYGPAMKTNFNEQRIKDMMRAKILLMQNATDEHGSIRDYLAMNPQQLREMEIAVTNYFKDMKIVKDRMDASRGQQILQQPSTQAQAQQVRPPNAVAQSHKPSQPAVPMGKTVSQQSHVRKPSSSSKVPPAPTENKTFDWGAPSPHGVPKYDPGRNDLTPDKLKFPPQKKRRTGQPDSQGSTPAAQQTGTPRAVSMSPGVSGVPATAKASSPEQARKNQQQIRQETEAREAEQQRKYRCRDGLCEASIKGFETEEELKKHFDVEHAPVEDALDFFLANAATAYGVDMEGNPLPAKQDPSAISAQARSRAQALQRPGLKKEGQTPNIKSEVATPPAPPLGRLRGKLAATSTPDDKALSSRAEAPQQEFSLREAIEDKIGFESSAHRESKTEALPEPATNDSEDPWQEMIRSTLSGVDGLDDWAMLEHVSDWGLRPEAQESDSSELTPNDGTASSRESDISQTERLVINFEWDPFGNNDTYVPEALKLQTLGLGDESDKTDVGNNVTMADGGEASAKTGTGLEDVQTDNKAADPWDWSADDVVDWETTYGPNAGLEDHGLDWSKDPFGLNAY